MASFYTQWLAYRALRLRASRPYVGYQTYRSTIMHSKINTVATYHVEYRKAHHRDYHQTDPPIKWHEEQLARDELASHLLNDPTGDYRLIACTKTTTTTVMDI